MKNEDISKIEKLINENKCKETLLEIEQALKENDTFAMFYALSIYSGVYDSSFRNEDTYGQYLKFIARAKNADDDLLIHKFVNLLIKMENIDEHDKLINLTYLLLPQKMSEEIEGRIIDIKRKEKLVADEHSKQVDENIREKVNSYIEKVEQLLKDKLFDDSLILLKESLPFVKQERDNVLRKKWLNLCNDAYSNRLSNRDHAALINSVNEFYKEAFSVYKGDMGPITQECMDDPRQAALYYTRYEPFMNVNDENKINEMFDVLTTNFFKYKGYDSFLCIVVITKYFFMHY